MPWWCDLYGSVLFVVGLVLLLGAAAAAIVQLVVAVRAMRAAARETARSAQASDSFTGTDAVKALDALKGLLETIKGLPAWIPVFVAGLALVWLAGQRPEACAPGAGAAPAAAPATKSG